MPANAKHDKFPEECVKAHKEIIALKAERDALVLARNNAIAGRNEMKDALESSAAFESWAHGLCKRLEAERNDARLEAVRLIVEKNEARAERDALKLLLAWTENNYTKLRRAAMEFAEKNDAIIQVGIDICIKPEILEAATEATDGAERNKP